MTLNESERRLQVGYPCMNGSYLIIIKKWHQHPETRRPRSFAMPPARALSPPQPFLSNPRPRSTREKPEASAAAAPR